MSSEPRSLLGAGELAELRTAARQGFRTQLELDQPVRTIEIRRWNEATQKIELLPGTYRVLIRYAETQANMRAGTSSEVSRSDGTVRGFAPLPLQIGDRFTLASGAIAQITAPGPHERFGIVEAPWTVEV